MSARVCPGHRPKFSRLTLRRVTPVDPVHNSPIDEYKEGMKELATKFDAQTIRTVAKLHDQFGHPSAKALAHELHMRKCPKSWVTGAKIYTCEWCATQRKPGLVRVAAIPRAQFFNHVVDTDINIVNWQGKKRPHSSDHGRVLTILRPKLVSNERQCNVKSKVLKNCGWDGLVLRLSFDATCLELTCPMEFASWCDGHGIKLELIPKAHHKMAIQERNHAVRRNQL